VEILRQLPFQDARSSVHVAGEVVAIRAYQIVIWMSLSQGDSLAPDARRFPAVLDTGHNHNFSIRDSQLVAWAGLRRADLPRLGDIVVNRQEGPQLEGRVWIHRNRPGTAELLGKPFRLHVPQGIAVYEEGAPGAPRLPLLGLRGVVTTNLRLTIDGRKMAVSLRS
jgi:hypothetical protein